MSPEASWLIAYRRLRNGPDHQTRIWLGGIASGINDEHVQQNLIEHSTWMERANQIQHVLRGDQPWSESEILERMKIEVALAQDADPLISLGTVDVHEPLPQRKGYSGYAVILGVVAGLAIGCASTVAALNFGAFEGVLFDLTNAPRQQTFSFDNSLLTKPTQATATQFCINGFSYEFEKTKKSSPWKGAHRLVAVMKSQAPPIALPGMTYLQDNRPVACRVVGKTG